MADGSHVSGARQSHGLTVFRSSRRPSHAVTLAALVLVAVPGVARATDGSWSSTGSMGIERNVPTLAALAGGKALVAGGLDNGGTTLDSAEVYSSSGGTWSATGSMTTARIAATSVTLADGRVLVAGGADSVGGAALDSVEIYDPTLGTWSTKAPLGAARDVPRAVLLADGKVLVVGGATSDDASAVGVASSERYDPVANTWTTAAMGTGRILGAVVRLANGKVLVAGGIDAFSDTALRTTELYDPATNTWSAGPSMAVNRVVPAFTLLPDGRALVAGGVDENGTVTSSAELYDPATNSWSPTSATTATSAAQKAIVLGSGLVLVSGDDFASELFDPVAGTWRTTSSPSQRRANYGLVKLTTGKVLLAGGFSVPCGCVYQSSAELYTGPPWVSAPATNLGDVLKSFTSPFTSVTITNTGDQTLTITSATLTGTNASEFAIGADGCSGQSVAAGGACTIQLTLTPSVVGARSATLQLVDNAPNTPQSVTLTGRGVELTVPSGQPTRPVGPVLGPPAITRRPADPSSDPDPLVGFTAAPGSAFECALDGAPFAACDPPLQLHGLADGEHRLLVRASLGGVTSPEASVTWRVDTIPPVAPRIEATDVGVQVLAGQGTSDEDLATGAFSCQLDDGGWVPCAPPHAIEALAAGRHRVEARLVDLAGNEARATSDIAVVAPPPDSARVPQADVVLGDDPGAGGSLAVIGARLRVGCILRSGTMTACDVAMFSESERAGAAASPPALGRGHATGPRSGVSQLPVRVQLAGRGFAALRARRAGLRMRFDLAMRSFTGRPVRRLSRRARVVLVRRLTVLFRGDSARLAPSVARYVRSAAWALRGHVRRISCVGNADASGTPAHAYRLGLARAHRVCAALHARGVAAPAAIRSDGDRRPRASNRTAAGRALNRRVDVLIEYR